MKKITLLLMLAALPFASCSSDNDEQRRNIKATIDGTPYIFNTVVVEQEQFNENGFSYTDVKITGSIDNDPSKTISIVVMEGATGDDASWYFAHFVDGDPFVKNESFNTNVSQSSGHYVKGTFSGTVIHEATGETKTISEGSFEADY